MHYQIDQLVRLSETLREPPAGGKIQKWLLGFIVPIPIALCGLVALVLHDPAKLGLDVATRVSRAGALAGGSLLLSLGLFLHFQWFWGNHQRLGFYSQLAKFVAAVVFTGALIASIAVVLLQS